MLLVGFFFATVSGYLVGIIGSSNNPVSDLTLSALVGLVVATLAYFEKPIPAIFASPSYLVGLVVLGVISLHPHQGPERQGGKPRRAGDAAGHHVRRGHPDRSD